MPHAVRAQTDPPLLSQMASGWVDRVFAPPPNYAPLRSAHLRPGTASGFGSTLGLGTLGPGRPGTAAPAGPTSSFGSPQRPDAPGGGLSPLRVPPLGSPSGSPSRQAPGSPGGFTTEGGSPRRPGTAFAATGAFSLTGRPASPPRPGTARVGIGSLWDGPVRAETGFEHRTPGQPPNHLTYQQRVWRMAPPEALSKKNGGILMDGSLMGAQHPHPVCSAIMTPQTPGGRPRAAL